MKIALICIAKNEDNYLKEWLSYHTKIGFDDIYVYENNWRYKGEFEDNVNFIEFDGEAKQIVAYNDFIKNYGKNYDWGCFIDVDEYIVLKKHKNIKDFVNNYREFNSIAINWVLFGDNNLEYSDNFSLVDRFTKREKKINIHIKSIINFSKPQSFLDPHSTNVEWVDSNFNHGTGPFNQLGNDNIIQLNHYFCKTRVEFIEKVNKGLATHINSFRKLEDYDAHNFNEIEDLTALKFKYE